MHLEKYVLTEVSAETYMGYTFYSEGPRGRVKKIIRFEEIAGGLYNLAFGDAIPGTMDIADHVVTNNNDTEKVLTTVASAVTSFTDLHPEATIYAEGSTPARTRLYKIGISKHWKYINLIFYIEGLVDNCWEVFRKDRNYECFLATRR